MLSEPFNTTLFIHYKDPYSSIWMNIMNETSNMIYYFEENYGFVNIGIIFLLSMNQKKIYNTSRLVAIAYFFVSIMSLIVSDMNKTLMNRDISCYLNSQYIINLVLYMHYTDIYGWNTAAFFSFLISLFTFSLCIQTFGLSLYAHEEEDKKNIKQISNVYWYVEFVIFCMKFYNGSSFISSKQYSFLLEQYETTQDHSFLKLLCISLGYITILSKIKPNGFDYNQIIGFTWLFSRYLIPDHDVCNILIGLFCLFNFIVKRCGNNSSPYFAILFIIVSIKIQWNEQSTYNYCQGIQDYMLHSLWIMPFEINSLLNINNIPSEMYIS